MNNINFNSLLDFLIEGSQVNETKKILVLFNDSRQKRKVLDTLIEELKNNPKFKINFNKPFLHKENLIRINNYYLYTGVKRLEKIINPTFFSNTTYYYE